MQLIDDFLPECDLKTELCKESLWEVNRHFHWQYYSVQSKNVFEDFCTHVWKNVYMSRNPVNVMGWEYWTHSMGEGKPYSGMGFHSDDNTIDKDNHTGEVKLAKFGFAYYAHDKLPVGGYLEIERPNGELERIQAKPNRLVIFDTQTPHRVAPVTEGVRWSLISAVWDERPWHYDDNNVSIGGAGNALTFY